MAVLNRGLKLKGLPHKKAEPLWKGPCDSSSMGGVTQSMIGRFLNCRERFRLTYIEGLRPIPKFDAKIEVGQMWHVCEEALARTDVSHMVGEYRPWEEHLLKYAQQAAARYDHEQEDVDKWYRWVKAVFPEYVKYWSTHKDVKNRTPLMQEQTFHVPYKLPSSRIVYLRGKYDAVDLIKDPKRGPGVWLQENKTKGDLNQERITRQLAFDLQTMLYLVALEADSASNRYPLLALNPIRGVRYNCIWRNLPIRRHKGKVVTKKLKSGTKRFETPPETWEAYTERFLNDYVRAEPDRWFKRWQVEVTPKEITTFRQRCLDPILEQMVDWYEWYEYVGSTQCPADSLWSGKALHWIHPHGVYNVLNEGGSSDLDEHIYNGSLVGLRQVNTLFEELQ